MAMKISQGITQGLTLQSLCVSHEYKQRGKKTRPCISEKQALMIRSKFGKLWHAFFMPC